MMARIISSRSPTHFPIGPHVVRLPGTPERLLYAVVGNLAEVGLSPNVPQADEGIRILPARSVPIPPAEQPRAIRHASPPELPPEERSQSYGLLHEPNIKFLVSDDNPPQHIFDFRNGIAP